MDEQTAGDHKDPIRERAAALGNNVAENGPGVLLDEIEQLLPEQWREQIRMFPLAAVLLGLGAGIFLGMKKSAEVMAAGTSLISAAAMTNLNGAMDKIKGS